MNKLGCISLVFESVLELSVDHSDQDRVTCRIVPKYKSLQHYLSVLSIIFLSYGSLHSKNVNCEAISTNLYTSRVSTNIFLSGGNRVTETAEQSSVSNELAVANDILEPQNLF